jgi:hypothetical protein
MTGAAAYAAAGICVLARRWGKGSSSMHPERCRFCTEPVDELERRMSEYGAHPVGAEAVRRMGIIPEHVRNTLVREAQGYTEGEGDTE